MSLEKNKLDELSSEEKEKKLKEETEKFLENKNKLRKFLTWEKLEWLIKEIKKFHNKEKISQKIEELKNIVESSEIPLDKVKNIEEIKNEIEKETKNNDKKFTEDEFFWQKWISIVLYGSSVVARWENPQSILDEFVWLVVWLTDSLWTLAKFWKDIVVDFVKLPYDIYKNLK